MPPLALGNRLGLQFVSQVGANKYRGAAAVYSLHKISSSTRNVVRVRRSDDTAQDFTAAQVSDGTLESFCGVGDGFVTTWYDQSGKKYDAREPNALYQPKIVENGNLVTDTNGRAAINGKGAKLRLGHFSWLGESPREMLSNDGTHSTFMVCDLPDQTAGNASPFNTFVNIKSTSASINNRPLIYLRTSDGSLVAATSDGTSTLRAQFDLTTVQSAQLITDIVNPSGTNQQEKHSIYVNGNLAAVQNYNSFIPVDANTTLSENSVLFDRTETAVDTYISELIYYPSDQSANRSAIEATIGERYGITV